MKEKDVKDVILWNYIKHLEKCLKELAKELEDLKGKKDD